MIPKQLYKDALDLAQQRGYYLEKYSDEMSVLSASIGGWWKPQIILDDKDKTAVRFMSSLERLCCITRDDIDWESMKGLSAECIKRAENFDAHFPTNIRGGKGGVAEVEWQINPDGRYFMDSDGFGMSDDEEVSLYGYIDRHGKPLCKFTYVGENYKKLDALRAQANKALKR